jgi:hypothetical protein
MKTLCRGSFQTEVPRAVNIWHWKYWFCAHPLVHRAEVLHVHEFREYFGMQSTLGQVVIGCPAWIRDLTDWNFCQNTDYPDRSLQSHQADADIILPLCNIHCNSLSSSHSTFCCTVRVTEAQNKMCGVLLCCLLLGSSADHSGRAMWAMKYAFTIPRTLGSWVRLPLRAWISLWIYAVFVLSCA